MYVIIIIKGSHDPLEGIQNIETGNLLSINQRQTQKFMENVYDTQRWKDLSNGEK